MAGVGLRSPRRAKPSSLALLSPQNVVNTAADYRIYRRDRADRRVSPGQLLAACPPAARALHIGGLALVDGADADVWAGLYQAMPGRGIFTPFDPNIRAGFVPNRPTYMRRLDRVFAATDLLKLSDANLLWLMPDPGVEAGVRVGATI